MTERRECGAIIGSEGEGCGVDAAKCREHPRCFCGALFAFARGECEAGHGVDYRLDAVIKECAGLRDERDAATARAEQAERGLGELREKGARFFTFVRESAPWVRAMLDAEKAFRAEVVSTPRKPKRDIDHHCQPWVVARRKAPSASVCVDYECTLSGGFAHVGPCEPCACPMLHAVEECPANRTDVCVACKGAGYLPCFDCKGVGLLPSPEREREAEKKRSEKEMCKSAADLAFDEIAILCGCPEWDYPGQVVRDVQRVVNERDGWEGTATRQSEYASQMAERAEEAERELDERDNNPARKT